MATKLGDLLRSEREKRELSLHEIGMSLKINPKILKAIEEGDQQNFPSKTFLRGFVKSYAQYLRLDPNEILQMFHEEYGSTRPEEPLKPPAQPQTSAPTPAHPHPAPKYETSLKRPEDAALPVTSNNRIYTILVAILLLTLIAFVAKMMDKYQKESEVSIVPIVDEVTTTTLAPVSGDETVAAPISGEASAEAAAEVSAEQTEAAPVTTTTVTTTTLKPAAPTSTTTMTVTTTTVKSTTTTTLRPTTTTTLKAVAPVVTTTTSSTTTSTAIKGVNTEVIIEALNRVTIRFTLTGGQNWETIELNPDQVHTFRSRSGIQLEVSDGGAVNVIVNGRDRGVPGTIGKPMKLNYP